MILRLFCYIIILGTKTRPILMSVISSCLDEVFKEGIGNKLSTSIQTGGVDLSHICALDDEHNEEYLLGCCKPHNVKILRNVMLRGERFYPLNNHLGSIYVIHSDEALPFIRSFFQGKEIKFRMHLSHKQRFEPCKKIFNGTLHVIDRATMHNMFHICEYIHTLPRHHNQNSYYSSSSK